MGNKHTFTEWWKKSKESLKVSRTQNNSPSIDAASPDNSLQGTRDDNTNEYSSASAAAPTVADNQVEDATEDLVHAGSLWDRAYNSLKDGEPDLITDYEKLLSLVPDNTEVIERTNPVDIRDFDQVKNQIPKNSIARQEKLKIITELGLKHMEDKEVNMTLLGHDINLENVMSNIAGVVGWAEEYVKDAVKDLPYASIIMAGVSLVLPLLKNPVTAKEANREGFAYVTSRIRYYGEMESLLLPEHIKPGVKTNLTEDVIELYKLIIGFQLHSVIHFYRSGTKNFFRGAVNYDDWASKVDDIKKHDKELREKFEEVVTAISLEELKKLSVNADESGEKLSAILNEIKQLTEIAREGLTLREKMDRRMLRDEERAYINALGATNPVDDKTRIEEDKGGLLEGSCSWVINHTTFQEFHGSGSDTKGRLLWIRGDPGKGKTMLVCGIINELSRLMKTTDNIAFFFCQEVDNRLNNATAVLRGLVYMLIKQQRPLISHVKERFIDGGEKCFEGPNAWVALSQTFTKICDDPNLQSTYLIIDALDECSEGRKKLLALIVKLSGCPRIKWILSSRNWLEIKQALRKATEQVQLHLELNEESVLAAITQYIQFKVQRLAEDQEYNEHTREDVQQFLLLNAKGTFLWVALVCKELDKISSWAVKEALLLFPPGLGDLYERMITHIDNSIHATLCLRILAVVSVVRRPISLSELETLVEMPFAPSSNDKALEEIVGRCGSFLTLQGRTVSFIHQSAKEFLLREGRDKIFPSGQEEVHYSIFSRSLQVLSTRILERDIYRLGTPGYHIDQVQPIDPDPLVAVQYSCIYWIDHFRDSSPGENARDDLQKGGSIDLFLHHHFLHWLETLSLLRSISKGIVLMAALRDLFKAQAPDSQVFNLVQDAWRFIARNSWVIERMPLQVYISALIFSPLQSQIRLIYEDDRLSWIPLKPAVEAGWDTCLQTLEGHDIGVVSVVFSPDGQQLASSSYMTVKIWDANSGACLQTLIGHDDLVTSAIFLSDGQRLASSSWDKTMKIWDIYSGACLQTLKGYNNWVLSVVFSPDNQWLSSGSWDDTVRIWDINSGACLQILEGHDYRVISVVFSPDSQRLASGSYDKTVKIWDINLGACLQTLKGHNDVVTSVVFLPDGQQLASSSWDKTVKIWDTSSGACLQTLRGHNGTVTTVILSPNSQRLASSSDDKTVKIWDTSSYTCLQTLKGHDNVVTSVVFSPDSQRLASSSDDKTVKIWGINSGACLQTLKSHDDIVTSVVFSPNNQRLASSSHDKTVKIWDANSDTCLLQTSNNHDSTVTSVVFSPDNQRLASCSDDKTVKIWDASLGDYLRTLKHNDRVTSVVFSPDSQQLASGSCEKTVRIWDINSGACLQTLNGHNFTVTSVIFSPDSQRLASGSDDNTVKIWDNSQQLSLSSWKKITRVWDTNLNTCLQTLKGHNRPIKSVVFSPDSQRLASSSWDETVRVWDINSDSGACLQILKGHNDQVISVVFSPDGQQLASSSSDRTVKIWDVNSGACLQTIYTDTAFQYLRFDATDNSRLLTDLGVLRIDNSMIKLPPSEIQLRHPNLHDYGISSGIWITKDDEPLLWLPSEYRPTASALSGATVAIGCESGRVIVLRFSTDKTS